MATSSRSKTTRSTSSSTVRSSGSGQAKKATARKAPTKKVEEPVAAVSAKTSSATKTTRWNKDKVISTIKKPQILVPVAVLLAVIVVYLVKSWFVVAVVNGQFITRPAFDSALQQQDGKQVLNNLITEKLLQQEAAKKGITVNQSDVDSQVKKIDQQLASQGQTLDQALAARGMTKADLEEQIKLQTLLQKLLGDQIKVSDKEIQDYINTNKDSLPTGESDAQVKDTVRQQLEQQKLTTAAQTLVQKLQAQAKITYFINL